MKIQIKNRWNEKVIFECEADTIREACEKAISGYVSLRDANLRDANLRNANLRNANLSDADLSDANLSDADLSDANLSVANLRNANLRNANLRNANLRNANLRNANLRDANLRDANLRNANLSDADLSDANLSVANLRNANLRNANLRNANLRDANLRVANLRNADLESVRVDFFDVLLRARSNGEVQGLIDALEAGKVDGSTYSGECTCLIGTIANYKNCAYDDIPNLKPNAFRPAEQFFLSISEGDTPATNGAAKIAVEWAREFLALTAHYGKAEK